MSVLSVIKWQVKEESSGLIGRDQPNCLAVAEPFKDTMTQISSKVRFKRRQCHSLTDFKNEMDLNV